MAITRRKQGQNRTSQGCSKRPLQCYPQPTSSHAHMPLTHTQPQACPISGQVGDYGANEGWPCTEEIIALTLESGSGIQSQTRREAEAAAVRLVLSHQGHQAEQDSFLLWKFCFPTGSCCPLAICQMSGDLPAGRPGSFQNFHLHFPPCQAPGGHPSPSSTAPCPGVQLQRQERREAPHWEGGRGRKQMS